MREGDIEEGNRHMRYESGKEAIGVTDEEKGEKKV